MNTVACDAPSQIWIIDSIQGADVLVGDPRSRPTDFVKESPSDAEGSTFEGVAQYDDPYAMSPYGVGL